MLNVASLCYNHLYQIQILLSYHAFKLIRVLNKINELFVIAYKRIQEQGVYLIMFIYF